MSVYTNTMKETVHYMFDLTTEQERVAVCTINVISTTKAFPLQDYKASQ